MVNIEELSAKELYELARKKEQEEERLAQVQKQLTLLKEEREQMLKKHQEELNEADAHIEQLKAERAAMVDSQKKALALVDKRLKSLETESQQAARRTHAASAEIEDLGETLPPPRSDSDTLTPPHVAPSPQPRENRADNGELVELKEHLKKMMKGRSYISEGLIREKLQAAKYRPANLGKKLETLVKEGWLVRRSGGNYVLGLGGKKK